MGRAAPTRIRLSFNAHSHEGCRAAADAACPRQRRRHSTQRVPPRTYRLHRGSNHGGDRKHAQCVDSSAVTTIRSAGKRRARRCNVPTCQRPNQCCGRRLGRARAYYSSRCHGGSHNRAKVRRRHGIFAFIHQHAAHRPAVANRTHPCLLAQRRTVWQVRLRTLCTTALQRSAAVSQGVDVWRRRLRRRRAHPAAPDEDDLDARRHLAGAASCEVPLTGVPRRFSPRWTGTTRQDNG